MTALRMVHALLWVWFGLNFVGVPRLVSRETLLGIAGALFAGTTAIAIAYVAGWWRAAFLALPMLLYWCWNQRRHWLFHFRGAPPEIVVKYRNLFGGNITILRRQPGRVVPDAYHTILHVLLVADVVLTLLACSRMM